MIDESMLPLAVTLLNSVIEPPSVTSVKREFRGVWVATVDNIDWPSNPGLSSLMQQQEMDTIVDRAARLNLNAILFQVRPHADALYPSALEPWSYYLTGSQGTGPNPVWDPLGYLIERAHRRGIEVHAWMNPFRASHPAQKGPLANSAFAIQHPEAVVQYGPFLWMNPALPIVQQRCLDVVHDLLDRYDLDGVHIDDYFYPYPVKQNGSKVDFPDGAEYESYRLAGGTQSQGDWRRQNVNHLVERLYKEIKAQKPWVKFGISPFGIYRPGVPAGIEAGIDQYAELYADCKLWLQQGWCDYLSPQLYWKIEQTPQSFPVLYRYWQSVNTRGRFVWPGLYTGQVRSSAGNWPTSQIEAQIRITRGQTQAPGQVQFSMKSLVENWKGISDRLGSSVYSYKAAIPEMHTIMAGPPARPSATATRRANGWKVSIDPDSFQSGRFAVYWVHSATNKWILTSISSDLEFEAPPSADYVAVATMDRQGAISTPLVVRHP